MSFWGELKRRNVYKVGVAYAIVAWLIIQAASIIFPHLNLPSWAVTLVIVIFIIGFPLALLLAWAYEVTPEGIKRTKEVPLAESITHLTGQKLNYIVTGLLVLAVGFLLVKDFYFDRSAVKKEVVTTEPEQVPMVTNVEKAKKTIAVLPFENLSSDPEQVYFVDGLTEEILNSLAQIPDLLVTGRTSSFSFKGSNKKTPEIANELGVENILEGSVRKAGNDLRITAQLLRGADGFHLWSKTYDRQLKDIFAVQEDIATAVANELKLTLGIGKSLKQLGGTDNVEAYELYLAAKGQIPSSDSAIINHALELIDEAIALDPEFALAWAHKAGMHIRMSTFGPSNQAYAELDAGLIAAKRAIEIEPNLAEGYYSLGFIQTSRGEFNSAESTYRKALELTNEILTFPNVIFPIHYLAVGNFKRANELLEEMVQNDPLNLEVRGFHLLSFGFLGDMQRTEEEYKRGSDLFGDQWSWGTVLITSLRLERGHAISRDEILHSEPAYDAAKEYLDSPQEALVELHRIYNNNDKLATVNLWGISIWAAYFGDPMLSMDSMEKVLSLNATNAFAFWFPVMREVRQLPRFKELVKKNGLVDYWNKFGWPDICHKLDNGDFECD